MDKKCPLYLEVFFFKGVYQHLDHFLSVFKRDNHIAADEFWLSDMRREFKNLSLDNKLKTQDKLVLFQIIFEKKLKLGKQPHKS